MQHLPIYFQRVFYSSSFDYILLVLVEMGYSWMTICHVFIQSVFFIRFDLFWLSESVSICILGAGV